MLSDMFTGIYIAQRDSWYRWDVDNHGDGLSEADFKPRQRHFFILPPKDAVEAARRENAAAAAAAEQRRINRRKRLFASPSSKRSGTPTRKPQASAKPLAAAAAADAEDEDESEVRPQPLDAGKSLQKQARDAAMQAAVASLVPRLKDSDKKKRDSGKKKGAPPGAAQPSTAARATARSSNASVEEEGGDSGGGDDDAAAPLDDGEGTFKFGLLGASVRAIRDKLAPRLQLANGSVTSALEQSSYLVLLSLLLPVLVAVAWAGRHGRGFPTLVFAGPPTSGRGARGALWAVSGAATAAGASSRDRQAGAATQG